MTIKRLKVKKGNIGTFSFTLFVSGTGKDIEEAWDDASEALMQDGVGCIPDDKEIELTDEEEYEDA